MVKLDYFYAGQRLDLSELNKLVNAIKELQDVHETLLKTSGDGCDQIRHHIVDHKEEEHDRFDTLLEE